MYTELLVELYLLSIIMFISHALSVKFCVENVPEEGVLHLQEEKMMTLENEDTTSVRTERKENLRVEDVLAMLEEIGTPEQADAYLESAVASKRKVMGFGHREYRVKDPRAVILQSLAEELFARFGHDDLYDVAHALETAAASRLGPKGIYPNVDFYSGLVYRKLGIPRDLFTPVFAISRVAGWLAHWREQLGANRIFRPSQIYTGTSARHWVPADKRVNAAGA